MIASTTKKQEHLPQEKIKEDNIKNFLNLAIISTEDIKEIIADKLRSFNQETQEKINELFWYFILAYSYNKKSEETISYKKIQAITIEAFEQFLEFLTYNNLSNQYNKINKNDIISIFYGFVVWKYRSIFNTFALLRKFGLVKDIDNKKDFLVVKRRGKIVRWDNKKVAAAVNACIKNCNLGTQEYKNIVKNIVEKTKLDVSKIQQNFVHVDVIQQILVANLSLFLQDDIVEAYVSYMSQKAAERVRENGNKNYSNKNFIVVLQDNGEETIFDLEELKKRVIFALQGLNIKIGVEEAINLLLKSVYNGINRRELNRLIVMNAKMLMERHYGYTLFAARILLSFIYEETLGFDFSKHFLYYYDADRNEYIIDHGVINKFYQESFIENVKRGVELGILDPILLELYDLEFLSSAIDYKYDLDFTYLGIQTLYDRYFIVDKTNGVHYRIEAPQHFWLRVAMGLGIIEKENNQRHTFVLELFDLYRKRLFCSSTPTLFNSGTIRPQLSSCYVYKVDDSLDSIMQRGIYDAAMLSKYAGGLGGSWTAVRGTGAKIKGTNGESQGVVPFLKIHNDMLVAVNQGGKRSGSGCAYLELWHNDIFDFLELRRNTGDERRRTHDMNTAVWIPDLFMKRVNERSHWTLFKSNEVPDLHELYGKKFEERYVYYEKLAQEGKIWGQRIEAIELWKQMLRMLYETGHPWMTFKDPCNVRNPQDHVGVIHSSNLCTEITLNTSENEIAVCNLGSIVLENHLDKNGNLDYELLRKTIRIAVRALDNVIDINYYPVQAAKFSNLKHRPIGLGMMGWHHFLMAKGIPFDSDEAVELADEVTEFIAYEAYSASSDLAAERGAYDSFKNSKWDRGLLPQDTIDILEQERSVTINVKRGGKLDWDALREKIKKQGMRNSNVLAIAPTATISNIMGSSPSIEPLYSNMYVKSNLSGDFVVLNKYLVLELEKRGLWEENIIKKIKYYDGALENIKEIPEDIKNLYKTAFDIDIFKLIDAAARRQKWIDQSQSLNIYIKSPDMKKLSHVYKYAWQCGLKTTYYLRTLGASAIEKSTVSKYEIEGNNIPQPKSCKWAPGADPNECEACQ